MKIVDKRGNMKKMSPSITVSVCHIHQFCEPTNGPTQTQKNSNQPEKFIRSHYINMKILYNNLDNLLHCIVFIARLLFPFN